MNTQKITGKISYDQWAPRTPFYAEVYRHWPSGEYQLVGHGQFNNAEECEEWLVSAHHVNPDSIAITEAALTAQHALEAEAIKNSEALIMAPQETMPLTENQIKAKILIVGRWLERQDWTRMRGKQAFDICEHAAHDHGATDPADIEKIATGAMVYVMEGGSAGHPGEALDVAEMEAEPSDSDRWAERENATYGKREPKGGAKAGCFDV
jgi:hypothetical protein